MATLHGIVIADPGKNNISFTRIEHDHFDVARKEQGRPLPQYVSEQDELNNFPRMMPSPKGGYTINECTIPISLTINNNLIAEWRNRRENLLADVEKAQLEADKYLTDEAINGGAWFDPKSNFPSSTFKETSRPKLRTIRNVSSRLINPNNYAGQTNYLYENGKGNFKSNYYENSTWKDSKGRIHLFERPFTRIPV